MKNVLTLVLILAAVGMAAVPNPYPPISSLTLRDGTILKSVEIVSFATDVVMARWEGGRGTINYALFPDEWQEVIQKARPAKQPARQPSPTRAPERPAAKPSEATPPSSGNLLLQDIDVRETERTNDYVYFAWTARVSNSSQAVLQNTRIQLLDKDGFKLGGAIGDENVLKAGVVTVLTGNSLVKRKIWEQVTSYRVELLD